MEVFQHSHQHFWGKQLRSPRQFVIHPPSCLRLSLTQLIIFCQLKSKIILKIPHMSIIQWPTLYYKMCSVVKTTHQGRYVHVNEIWNMMYCYMYLLNRDFVKQNEKTIWQADLLRESHFSMIINRTLHSCGPCTVPTLPLVLGLEFG